MSSRRGNDMESGAFGADTSAKVNPEKDLTDENKAEWMKRRAREERKHRQGLKISDEWFEVIQGKKLVKKLKKNNGGVYSIYVGNMKNPKTRAFFKGLTGDGMGSYREKVGTK